jgi:hypothetical protein
MGFVVSTGAEAEPSSLTNHGAHHNLERKAPNQFVPISGAAAGRGKSQILPFPAVDIGSKPANLLAKLERGEEAAFNYGRYALTFPPKIISSLLPLLSVGVRNNAI